MKKILMVSAFLVFALPAFSETRGDIKDYYSEVKCPNGDVIEINGRCCEPGSLFLCAYVSCANYTPPAVTCLSTGG
jgi:hypothetical protein